MHHRGLRDEDLESALASHGCATPCARAIAGTGSGVQRSDSLLPSTCPAAAVMTSSPCATDAPEAVQDQQRPVHRCGSAESAPDAPVLFSANGPRCRDVLDLSHNRLALLSKRAQSALCSYLAAHRPRVLSLAYNDLHAVPELPLAGAAELDVSHNRISALPPSLFAEAGELRRLRMHDNALAELPASLARLASLESLSVGGNVLRALSGLETCAALVEVSAEDCRVSELPDLARLPALRRLLLAGNCLGAGSGRWASSLPPGLQSLDVSRNGLAAVPADATWPSALRVLNLSRNRLSAFDRRSLATLPADCAVLLADNPLSRANLDASAPPCDAARPAPPPLFELAARSYDMAPPALPPSLLPNGATGRLAARTAVCAACPARTSCAAGRVCLLRAMGGHAAVPVIEDACSPACLRVLMRADAGNDCL